MASRPKKLLDQVRDAIRVKHYSIRIVEAYVSWIRRYICVQRRESMSRRRGGRPCLGSATGYLASPTRQRESARQRDVIGRRAPLGKISRKFTLILIARAG